MSKLLTVFGATGQQGGSIISHVLNDPELSKEYKLRGLTRDTSKPAAQALQEQAVEMVSADSNDQSSLEAAMKGSHTVFGMTMTEYVGDNYRTELHQGMAIANAAVAAGVKYLIFSTLPYVRQISGGKYMQVGAWDSKAEVEAHIRTLPIKSAFFSPGSFMQNHQHMMAPRPIGDGIYAVAGVVTPDSQLPLIETAGDTGKYVGAILANPDKYEGKVFSAATSLASMEEIVEELSKSTGKTVKYKQLPVDVYKSFLPPSAAEQLVEMFLYIQDFGYYGPKTIEDVEWTRKQVRGKLTTFAEYLAKNPIQVQ